MSHPFSVIALGTGTCFPTNVGEKERADPGFLVRWGHEDDEQQHLLLDCSAGISERLVRTGMPPHHIKHVAITHAHADHCCLHGYMQRCICHALRDPAFKIDDESTHQRLRLFAPQHIIDHLPALNAFFFEGDGPRGPKFPIINPVSMTPEKPGDYRVEHLPGEAKLWSRRVYHDSGKSDALAFRLDVPGGSIAYSGDAGFDKGQDTSHQLIELAREVDLFVCEASAPVDNNQAAFTYGHLNPKQAGDIALRARVKRLLLTHYSGVDSDHAMIAACLRSGYRGEIIIAKDYHLYQ